MKIKNYIIKKRISCLVVRSVLAGIIGLSTLAMPLQAKADLAFDLCVAEYLQTAQQRINTLQLLESISPSRDTSYLDLILKQNYRQKAIEACENSVFGSQEYQNQVENDQH